MTTALRIRACHVGIFGIAKIGTSNLRRIVLPFLHQALTPLRSPSAKQRVNQPFAGSPHSSVLPDHQQGFGMPIGWFDPNSRLIAWNSYDLLGVWSLNQHCLRFTSAPSN